MLHTESPHRTIYAPLNQVMTDSESEEEIHNSTKHRLQQINRHLGTRNLSKLQYNSNTIVGNGHNYHHQPNSDFSSTYTTNMQNTFRSVMMSDMGAEGGGNGGFNDHGSNFSSFNSDYDERNQIDADTVAILGRGSSKDLSSINEPMSTRRRCCFIASLVLCVFAIFGFVWLVPCESATCPAPVDKIKAHNWFNNYTKIELKGGVNIVNGLRNWENNLIFLYRGDAFFPEFDARNTKHNGIISLIGSSGAVAWYDEMMDEPVAIDCTLLDVDNNGRSDCLVIDEYGELGAINPLSGQWHWRYKERSAYKVDALDFPVILPDLDGDGVLEILIVASAELEHRTKSHVYKGDLKHAGVKEERNYLRILSGRLGAPIGDGFKIHDCDVLRKLQLENSQTVTFNCLRNNTEAQRSKTLAELFALITNKSIVGQKLMPASKISQHRHYGQRKDIDAQRNIYSLSGRELVVENRGKCPEDCNVTFILWETRNNKTSVLRNFTNSGMYGMVPAQWHFKNMKTEMSGFVMKFWEWNISKPAHNAVIPKYNNSSNTGHAARNSYAASTKKATKTNTSKDNSTKTNKPNHIQTNKTKKSRRRKRELSHKFHAESDAFSTFDRLIQKRHTFTLSPLAIEGFAEEIQRATRSVHANVTKQKSGGNLLIDKYKMQMITEKEILVLFIGADTRIENTSQSNIVQFCRNDHNEVICQPDLNNQENSMLIADLDQDGSLELVSYMSTFVQANENPLDWKLETYVRLLRFQSDFIYTEEKRN